MSKINEEFDEFVNRFIGISIKHIDLIKVDQSLIDILLQCDNQRLFEIKCWLAQKKLYFRWD